MTTTLFVDDEEHIRLAMAQAFDLADLPHRCFDSAQTAIAEIGRATDAVLVTDIRMPGMDGTELMKQVLQIDPDFPVILITGHGDVDLAVACMQNGAYDFVQKPFEPADLIDRIRRARDKRRLTLENRALRQALAPRTDTRLITRSPAMADAARRIQALAAADVDVLITGDTGTGKERAARLLHSLGTRADRPFIHLSCGALPAHLIENELFGHEPGAFPGALRARFGKIEHANHGILCLDEIDSLPVDLQPKLLHVLQHRTVTRLGSNDPYPLDIRVIAIAKGDLQDRIASGTFRSDLYYLLNTAQIRIPPLSDRREDIPALFTELCAEAALRHNRRAPLPPGHLLLSLAARDWPGNVRELANMADRYVLDLDLDFAAPANAPAPFADQMAAHEKALITAAIAANGGRLRPTYEALGMSRRTLYEKMQRHGLDRDDFLPDADE
ncbi:sigma-54-dependent transcriptional regulator [Aestuariibius sp. 2305UL40-4]|uniref:sigma-54-dependent transcriptional regulator n=1 Tax=Aestuariibius violaceus TaxID=3234132 RepID=UPI00345E7F62